MTDSLTRGFGAQLTTSMDAVLRRAVFEIMNIFENTVYDYRMEIAHKGEEVSQLKIKLEAAELKLKACENYRGEEVIQIPAQTKTPPQAAPETLTQPNDVSEVDVDVPEDWCAPLGSETVTIQDFGICPNVKLRPLSIPLWHVHISKTVGDNFDVATRTKTTRRSSRIPASSQNPNPVKKLPPRKRKRLVVKLKEYSSGAAQVREPRRSNRRSAQEANKRAAKKKKRAKDLAAASRLSRQQHVKLVESTASPAKLSSEGESTLAASKTPTTKKTKTTPSSDGKTQTNASTEKSACPECDQMFATPHLLKQHMRAHLRTMSIPCSQCPVKCRTKRGMNIHFAKSHNAKSHDNEDLTWTEPLEEIDDETQDLSSICTKSGQEPNDNNKENKIHK